MKKDDVFYGMLVGYKGQNTGKSYIGKVVGFYSDIVEVEITDVEEGALCKAGERASRTLDTIDFLEISKSSLELVGFREEMKESYLMDLRNVDNVDLAFVRKDEIGWYMGLDKYKTDTEHINFLRIDVKTIDDIQRGLMTFRK